MSSGLSHLFFGLLLSFSLFAGLVLVDFDHFRTHTVRELADSFFGKAKLSFRDDSLHWFHNDKHFYYSLIIVLSLSLFMFGWYVHLSLDNIF